MQLKCHLKQCCSTILLHWKVRGVLDRKLIDERTDAVTINYSHIHLTAVTCVCF